jgi:hypothetical protein
MLVRLTLPRALAAVALAGAPSIGACAEQVGEQQLGMCSPDAIIFCRCPGGAPGTKRCLSTGEAFGSCGPCDDRPDPPEPSSSSGWGGSPSSSSGDPGGWEPTGGADGAVVPGAEPLLAPCQSDSDCQSLACRMGFCTHPCKVVSDCPWPESECVPFDPSMTLCIPSCKTASDCTPYGAPPSMCGYTHAVDSWGVSVCAHWGDEHELMPLGTDCLPFDHAACNLGYQHAELVCTEQGVCATGCYLDADCPMGEGCPSKPSFGACQ